MHFRFQNSIILSVLVQSTFAFTSSVYKTQLTIVNNLHQCPLTTLRSTLDDDEGSLDLSRLPGATSLLPETSFGSEMVPEGQRPVNEYLDLVRAPLFGWASEEVGSKGLLSRLVTVYAVSFFTVCYPISGATFTQEGYLIQKLTASNVGAVTLIMFLLLRLYTGWAYIGERLKSKVIEYEETGWYDGDIEYKTDAERQRDMFLFQSNVRPVVDRLKLFSFIGGLLLLISCFGLNLAVTAKPLFDEYDPKFLEKLTYDDKLAGVAADQSFSRPTYCDSRYYRAVANGGQGCGEP